MTSVIFGLLSAVNTVVYIFKGNTDYLIVGLLCYILYKLEAPSAVS